MMSYYLSDSEIDAILKESFEGKTHPPEVVNNLAIDLGTAHDRLRRLDKFTVTYNRSRMMAFTIEELDKWQIILVNTVRENGPDAELARLTIKAVNQLRDALAKNAELEATIDRMDGLLRAARCPMCGKSRQKDSPCFWCFMREVAIEEQQ